MLEVSLAPLDGVIEQRGGILTAQRSQVGQIHVIEALGHRRRAAASLDQRLQSQPVRSLVRGLGGVQMEFVNERRQELPIWT